MRRLKVVAGRRFEPDVPVANDDRPTASYAIRFQGRWEDEESGLHYNRFRYYDPEATQYLSPDPIGLGGVRPQGYVADPNGWVDPLGLAGCRPPNLAPEGAGRRGALRAAKRHNNVPVTQHPIEVRPSLDRNGRPNKGLKEYVFKDIDGNEVVIREDPPHVYPDDPSQNRGKHFNGPDNQHFDFE